MSISVIIPVLNEQKYIQRLVACLAKQRVKPKEIILVDGGSTDKTRQIAKKLPVTLYKTKQGTGWQRSYGGHRASGDVLVFFDADVLPPPDFLQRVERICLRRKLAVACPLFHPQNSRLDIILVYWVFNGIFFLLQRLLPSGAGMCIVVKRSIFQKAGGFDPQFIHDDIHFIRKASAIGKFGILPVILPVSDRRFRKEGTVKTLAMYALLSVCFLFGAFKLANKIPYKFAHYQKSS
jgi:glycosyltransferase involved in cell wall biosynthesis